MHCHILLTVLFILSLYYSYGTALYYFSTTTRGSRMIFCRNAGQPHTMLLVVPLALMTKAWVCDQGVLSGTCFTAPAHYVTYNDSTFSTCCARCEADRNCAYWVFRDPAVTHINAGCSLKPLGAPKQRADPLCTSGYGLAAPSPAPPNRREQ